MLLRWISQPSRAPETRFWKADRCCGRLAGFLEALLSRGQMVASLQVPEAEASSAIAAALDLADEAGLNRKGLQRLVADGADAAAATLQHHARIARCVHLLAVQPGHQFIHVWLGIQSSRSRAAVLDSCWTENFRVPAPVSPLAFISHVTATIIHINKGHLQANSNSIGREALGLAPGEAAVVTNGRVVPAAPPAGAEDGTGVLVAGDFALLQVRAGLDVLTFCGQQAASCKRPRVSMQNGSPVPAHKASLPL